MSRSIETKTLRLIPSSSLDHALTTLGDGSTFAVLRHAFLGVSRFDEFHMEGGITRRTLSKVIKRLLEDEILHARPYQSRPLRSDYKLTEKGLALYPVMLMFWKWDHTWNSGHAHPDYDFELRHIGCGKCFEPRMICLHCRNEVHVVDIRYEINPVAMENPRPMVRRRWGGSTQAELPTDNLVAQRIYALTDRWSHLTLGAIFVGRHSYGSIRDELGIAPGILSHRLNLLIETGFIDKRPAREGTLRLNYHLTDMGRDVFQITLALMQWSQKWLEQSRVVTIRQFHRTCGAPLDFATVCGECGETLDPRKVTPIPVNQ